MEELKCPWCRKRLTSVSDLTAFECQSRYCVGRRLGCMGRSSWAIIQPDAHAAAIREAAEIAANFDNWAWCKCSECKVDAGSHAIATADSLSAIAAAILAKLEDK